MNRRDQFAGYLLALLVAAVLAATGGCATSSMARTGFVVEEWIDAGFTGRRLTSAHFEIFSTLHDRTFEAGLPGFLEAAHDAFKRTLSAEGGGRLKVFIFQDRESWLRFTRRRYPNRFSVYERIVAGGFTEGDTSVSFYTDRSTTLATLAHEGWHQYVNARVGRGMPAWLNEGLACRFEAFTLDGDRVRFDSSHNAFRLNSLREGLQRGQLLSVREVVETNAGDVLLHSGARFSGVYYAQAWALTTFLQRGTSGHAAGFQRMLRDLADGRYRARVSAAQLSAGTLAASEAVTGFEVYFGVPPEAVQKSFEDYLVRLVGF